MAKVTITIEDKKDDEGVDGLLIGWDSSHPDDEESLANIYSANFIQGITSKAKTVTDLSDEIDKTKNEEMN